MKILFSVIHAPLQQIRVFDTIWDGLLTLLDALLPKHIHIPGMYALYALRYYYHNFKFWLQYTCTCICILYNCTKYMACVLYDNKCTMSGFKGVAPLPNSNIFRTI